MSISLRRAAPRLRRTFGLDDIWRKRGLPRDWNATDRDALRVLPPFGVRVG